MRVYIKRWGEVTIKKQGRRKNHSGPNQDIPGSDGIGDIP